jgi:hypothetical protein
MRDMSVRRQKSGFPIWQADALAPNVVSGMGRPYHSLWTETAYLILSMKKGGK